MLKIKNTKIDEYFINYKGFEWIAAIRTDKKDNTIECWLRLENYGVSMMTTGHKMENIEKDTEMLIDDLFIQDWFTLYIEEYAPELAD